MPKNFNPENIVLAKDFDASKLIYNDVKILDNGGKMVFLSYNNPRSPLIIQTPEMPAPFGMSKWVNDNSPDKYTIDLSFRGMDNHPGVRALYNVMDTLDKKLVEDGFANQQTWFKGKKFPSVEVMQVLYTPFIRQAKDKDTGEVTDKYPPTFKVKLPVKEGVFECEVYDTNRELVDLNTINTKGAGVSAIIQCTGLWFAGGKFGANWQVVQMRIRPTQKVSGFAFKEDPDDVQVQQDLDEDLDEDENAVVKSVEDDVVSDSDDELEKTVKSSSKVVVKRR